MAILTPVPRRIAAALVATGLAVCAPTEAGTALLPRPVWVQESLENDIKAAFLYNFTKFVEWPAAARDFKEPFRLCVLADPAFTQAIDRIIEGESVGARKLVRVEPQSVEQARTCDMLYVGKAETDRGSRLVTAVRQLPILTVGESSRFVDQGGAIGFVTENNRVRFDVSQRAAERSGLKVSSKLLRVARHVKKELQE